MKKIMQKRIEVQTRRAEAADKLLRERKRQIEELKEENEGLREFIDIMGAFVGECVESKGEIRINRHNVRLELAKALEIGVTDDEYILRRTEKQKSEA